MSIIVYTFESADGKQVGDFSTQSAAGARDHARQHGYNVIANEYEFNDSYLVTEWQFANEEETP